MELSIIQKIIVWGLPLIFAITLHEVAHGYVAYLRGDSTAKMLGRLTLNPIKHIDLVGTVLVPILVATATNFNFIFGWAKPVPINWRNLKHPRQDMILVAFAGPFANLLMAFIWAVIAKIGFMLPNAYQMLALFLIYAGQAGLLINIVLMVLNLLPIPPLDGSKLLTSLLPLRMSEVIYRFEIYGFLILTLLIFTGILQKIIQPIIALFVRFFVQLLNL